MPSASILQIMISICIRVWGLDLFIPITSLHHWRLIRDRFLIRVSKNGMSPRYDTGCEIREECDVIPYPTFRYTSVGRLVSCITFLQRVAMLLKLARDLSTYLPL